MSNWLKRFDSARYNNRSVRLAATTGLTGLLLVVLSSAGFAGVNATPVVYYACVNKSTNEFLYSAATAVCPAGYVKEHWNQRGPQGPAGPQGPPGVPSVSIAKGTNGTEINGTFPTVDSLSLPAGNYLVTAKDVPYDRANQVDTVLCYLEGPGGFTDLRDQAQGTLMYDPNAGYGIASLMTTAVISLSAPGTVYLQCGDEYDSPTTTASSGAVITAMLVA
jgi:hypothetical protein